jgi:hypothetical protein
MVTVIEIPIIIRASSQGIYGMHFSDGSIRIASAFG